MLAGPLLLVLLQLLILFLKVKDLVLHVFLAVLAGPLLLVLLQLLILFLKVKDLVLHVQNLTILTPKNYYELLRYPSQLPFFLVYLRNLIDY